MQTIAKKRSPVRHRVANSQAVQHQHQHQPTIRKIKPRRQPNCTRMATISCSVVVFLIGSLQLISGQTPAPPFPLTTPVQIQVANTVLPSQANAEYTNTGKLVSPIAPPTSFTFNNHTYQLLDANKELIDYGDEFMDALSFVQTEKSLIGLDEATKLQSIESMLAKHHNNEEMHQYLLELAQKYPEITHLYSVGKSTEGRELWVLEISEEPGKHKPLKPEFKYVANMHGNEVVGRELLLHLARLLVENYRASMEEPIELRDKPTAPKFVKKLLRDTRIHLMPSMNPDGYVRSKPGCIYEKPSKKGRLNANNVDLNRNFPDPVNKNSPDAATQPEVEAIMRWSHEIPFVLSANLHSGTLAVVYPHDGSLNKTIKRDYRATPDDDVFRQLARTYSFSHPTMFKGERCYDECTDYHKELFPEGITNGAEWFSLYGSMEDWIYMNTNCMDTTIELGCNQYPEASRIPEYWQFNKRALLNYIKQIHKGIKGLVSDQLTGQPLANVTIHVIGREHNITSNHLGDYYRILLPGEYEIIFEKSGYLSEKIFVSVQDTMPQLHNIKLRPLNAPPAGSFTTVKPVESSNALPLNGSEFNNINSEEHSILVATLVMTVVILILLIMMMGAYVIQKRRLVRIRSVSMEMQPKISSLSASSGTGISLPLPPTTSGTRSPGSSTNPHNNNNLPA